MMLNLSEETRNIIQAVIFRVANTGIPDTFLSIPDLMCQKGIKLTDRHKIWRKSLLRDELFVKLLGERSLENEFLFLHSSSDTIVVMDKRFIQKCAKKDDFLISEHAHQARQEEEITVADIKYILTKGQIIEQYPKDPRGESCLVSGKVDERRIHIVCGKRVNKLVIVTVYLPKLPKWSDWKTRAKEVTGRV